MLGAERDYVEAFRAAEEADEDSPECEAARERYEALGRFMFQTPAKSLVGAALKLRLFNSLEGELHYINPPGKAGDPLRGPAIIAEVEALLSRLSGGRPEHGADNPMPLPLRGAA